MFPGISESPETDHQSWTEETDGTRLFCGKIGLRLALSEGKMLIIFYMQDLDKSAKERDQRRNKHKEKHKKKKKKKKHYRSETEESDSESDIDYFD